MPLLPTSKLKGSLHHPGGSLTPSPVVSAESGWATDAPKKANKWLSWYQKSEYFWVLLILIDIIAKGTRTADASISHLHLLGELWSLYLPECHKLTTDRIDLAFTIIFDFEIILRFVIYLPDWKAFITSRRNLYDLFLAIACSITQIPPIPSANVYAWLTVFQLLRWYRFILAFPRMRPLIVSVASLTDRITG